MLIARDAGKPAGLAGLGLIPSWQFSPDPHINPKINPFVKFPPGMTQSTVQPVGPYMGLGSTEVGAFQVPLWLQLLSMASAGASAYHGYKRNDSIGWAIGWGILGTIFPVLTPAVALAQGFGKAKK